MEDIAAVMEKKRKFSFGERDESVKRRTRGEDVDTSAISENSSCDTVAASYYSSDGSGDAAEVQNREEDEVTVDQFSATSLADSFDSRESFRILNQAESSLKPLKLTLQSHFTAAEKMPTEDDLEQFFAAAEQKLQQQFIAKYNYDIVKDSPLEGRFEWVKILQKP